MPTKIRSGYQRRILDWLTDGGGSISEAATKVGLRLPHASATFKKLRTEGLVTIDQSEKQRGSIQRLTPKGWARIEHDEIARFASIDTDNMPNNAIGCLVARDGPMLLLGYLNQPQKEGFLLPSKAIQIDMSETSSSNGNIGVEVDWAWAVARESKPRWFSLPDLQPINNISQAIPEGITTWNQKEKSIGLIRARLLEPDKPFSLAAGSWFCSAPSEVMPKLPALLNEDYSWTLATFHDNHHKIKPQQPVIAEINRRLGINLLLEAAACDGIVIGEAGLLSRETDSLPTSLLEHWIKRIHPKLTEKSQKTRFDFLLGELGISNRTRKKRRTSGEQSTWGKFKLDWANSPWSEEIEGNDLFFDNSQLRKNALLSIIDWAMNDSKGVPLSIQWPRNIILGKKDSEHILRYPALRIIITEKWEGSKPTLLLKEAEYSSLPIMDLCLERGLKLPISVEISTLQTSTHTLEEKFTIPPQLMNLIKKSQIDINKNSNELQLLIECSKQFPIGNEFEANKLEYDNPLESWIITPSNFRWLRWQRISKRIENHWVELLPPELVPIEHIGTIALSAPIMWKLNARKILNSRLQVNPDSSLDLRKILLKGSLEEKAWWFSCLMTSAQWIAPSIRINLIEVGLKPWIDLQHKLSLNDFTEVLNSLNWMQKLNEIDDSWISLISSGETITQITEVKLWKILITKFQNNSSISFDNISEIISIFDIEWWSPLAEEFFKICIESPRGRLWLESKDIPWAAAILREPGEIHNFPGYGTTIHSGCSNDLLEYVEQYLSKTDITKDSKGVLQIIDLKNALNNVRKGIPPFIGKCHKHCGWLVQPIELWPELNSLIDVSGNEEVSRRLYLKKTGYHKGLKISPQTKLS